MKRLVLLILLAGCSVGLSCGGKAFHTMTGAFATCAEADLGQIVPSGLPLLSDVASKIEGNDSALEADFTALAKLVGIDAVKCAIVAVEAVISQPAATGSGSGSAAIKLAVKPPGLERAIAWSKAQK